jgi:hypothetical protein
MARDSFFFSSGLGNSPGGSPRSLKRLWGRVGAFWSGTRVARWILLVVLLLLLALFLGPILSWLHQPFAMPRLTPNVINFFTLYLALSGILYAIVHEKRLDEQVLRLQAIERSLSTRRLGQFPDYLDEIGNLLDGASRLTILADCADYGSFFAPDEHEALHDAVCRFSKAEGHTTRILVAGPPAPFTAASSWSLQDYTQRYNVMMNAYWPKYIKTVREDRPFLEWLGKIADDSGSDPDPRFELFAEWLSSYWSEVPEGLRDVLLHTKSVCDGSEPLEANRTSAEAFLALLQARQYWFEKLLAAARADIKHVREPTSLFVWISHKTRGANQTEEDGIAIFAFPIPRADGRGALAFRTLDPELIKSFESIFGKLWPPKVNEKSGRART